MQEAAIPLQEALEGCQVRRRTGGFGRGVFLPGEGVKRGGGIPVECGSVSFSASLHLSFCLL